MFYCGKVLLVCLTLARKPRRERFVKEYQGQTLYLILDPCQRQIKKFLSFINFQSPLNHHKCCVWMKRNSNFELKISLNHLSESKCRRGLNLDPMVQVTGEPCRLMVSKTLNKIFSRHLIGVNAKLKMLNNGSTVLPILVRLRTWRYHVRQKLF